jgi:hypothetical protein
MELRAVVETLTLLPEGMHLWISTDSADVKKGITEWTCGWVQRYWRTGNDAPVGNKDLWQALVHTAARHARVEWSWVRAHSGLVLNECVDVLATRGIFNKPRQNDDIQVMVPVGEDTDSTQYALEDGEETLSVNWKEPYRPERTYIWVSGAQVSICPPPLFESGRGASYSHIADHPAESLLSPRSAPIAPNPEVIVVSGSETEPES